MDAGAIIHALGDELLHDGAVRRGDVASGEDVDGLDLVGATVDVRSGEGLG